MTQTKPHPPNRPSSLSQEQLQRANLGRRYWGAEIDAIPEAPHKGCLRLYLDELARNRTEGWGLYLWGDNSVGKTYAACAVLKEAMRRRYSAYCILADVLRAVYIDRSMFDADMSVVQRVETVDFLLIEDLGKEYTGKDSGWAELCLENLLRKRSRELRPTITTTNLTPKGFKERYRESAQAIALESMVAVQVKGPNWRAEAALANTARYREVSDKPSGG